MATSKIKLDDTGWIALDTYSYYRVKNGVITITIYAPNKSLTTSWQEVYRIPAEYAPKQSAAGLYCAGIENDGVPILVAIGGDGVIKAKRSSGSGSVLVACTTSYPIN